MRTPRDLCYLSHLLVKIITILALSHLAYAQWGSGPGNFEFNAKMCERKGFENYQFYTCKDDNANVIVMTADGCQRELKEFGEVLSCWRQTVAQTSLMLLFSHDDCELSSLDGKDMYRCENYFLKASFYSENCGPLAHRFACSTEKDEEAP